MSEKKVMGAEGEGKEKFSGKRMERLFWYFKGRLIRAREAEIHLQECSFLLENLNVGYSGPHPTLIALRAQINEIRHVLQTIKNIDQEG